MIVEDVTSTQQEPKLEPEKEEKACDIDEEQLLSVLIMRLKELDAEASTQDITTEAYQKCKLVMNQLLIYIFLLVIIIHIHYQKV